MPKNDKVFQRETGLPLDSGRTGGPFVPRTSEYPAIKGNFVKSKAQVRTVSPVSKANFRGSYDEQHGLEDNLGMRFVKPNAFDSKSTQSFKK